MSFESTHMGMKFFNRDIPNLINSINHVGDSLEKISKQSDTSKEERYKELLNHIINYLSSNKSPTTVIKTLLWFGFEKDELINEFDFTSSDVMDASKEMNDFDPKLF